MILNHDLLNLDLVKLCLSGEKQNCNFWKVNIVQQVESVLFFTDEEGLEKLKH